MNERAVEAKTKWAAREAGKTLAGERSQDRLPPGQREVHNFPVLDIGVRPGITRENWTIKISGLVRNPLELDWQEFMALPQVRDVSDMHCVTTWSQYDMAWEGVAFSTLAFLVQPDEKAKFVFFKGYDGYSTNNPIDVCMAPDVLIAHSWNGVPLTEEHGAPARVIIPKRYAWKGCKFIKEIRFLERDLLGFWELRGYSNTADPWLDDRFSS